MKLTFSSPDHWLTFVTARLAPFEREEAQAPFRARVARWREEGLGHAEIVARLGDAEATAAALARRFVRADEESSLRNQLTESPWWALFGSLILMGLSLLIEHSKKGQVTAWNALIPICGLLISLALLWVRRHLPLRWWLAFSPSGAWAVPLTFVALAVRAETSALWAWSWALGLGVLSVGARFVLPDRGKLAKLERLARHGSPRPAP
ncbi:hypothetical protein [Deinococcus sp. NW-56]|uniref:hypothetical protein n=1 Tax=Deinococcus sp. NW-56 TaxID=2080419 RepID=UPI00131A260E|nr:hypothetical protein [Deinococcus sp. NW-56]